MGNDHKKGTVCRICLCSVKKKGMSLFQEYKNYLLFEHINTIANVDIKEDDGLPHKICSACLLELETAINFKTKCENSNYILQTKLKCENSNVVLETSSIETQNNLEVDLNEIKVKKEVKEEDEIYTSFFDDNSIYLDSSDILETVEPKTETQSNKADLGIRKSRAKDLHLQCDDCGNYFKSKCKLRVHWKKEHSTQGLICNNCKRTFKSAKAYITHQKNKRKSCLESTNFRIEGFGKSRTFFCKECEYKSLRMKDMITHWVTHTGDRPFVCEICCKTHTQQSSLQAHMESAHKLYKVEMTCHFCGKFIKGRNRIYRHLKTHTDMGMKCPVCPKTLKNKNSLSQHMRRHSGVKSFTCDRCANTFYTSAELANHRRAVHNKGKYWYSCDLCDYKGIRSETVNKHKRRHTDTNISCTICGTFFESPQKLILHQRRHFEEKKHQCPHCEMRFIRKDSVGKHIRAKHKMTVPQRPVGCAIKQENGENKIKINIKYIPD